MTRLESRARRHAAQRVDVDRLDEKPSDCAAFADLLLKMPPLERVDIVAVEDALARRTFAKLPRRGGMTALKRAIKLAEAEGDAEAVEALRRRLVEVERISGRAA